MRLRLFARARVCELRLTVNRYLSSWRRNPLALTLGRDAEVEGTRAVQHAGARVLGGKAEPRRVAARWVLVAAPGVYSSVDVAASST